MRKRHLATLSGLLLGAAAGLIGRTGQTNVLALLLKPWSALGNLLRGWSFSGAKGNAAAWIVLIVLSLLPVIFILIARRRRKQPGDWLFGLTAAGIFAGLFLLVNPSLALHPMLAQSLLESSPELAAMGPTALMGSLLLMSALVRWSCGLNERRLIRWAQVILTGTMALIALALGTAVTEGVASLLPASADPFFPGMSAEGVHPADAPLSLLLELISLIPSAFLLWMLDGALTLTGALSSDWFTEETELNAARLAVRARQTLIAAAGCMALRNALTLALSQVLSDSSFLLEIPLTGLLTSCAAMLLARMLNAACRVKRDNDLMI